MMSKDEQAVMDVALELYHCSRFGNTGGPLIPSEQRTYVRLLDRIEELMRNCPRCNYDRHLCPGCGAHVTHGRYICKPCSEME